jgi:uncharacterized protein (TIGR03435 family)
MPNLAEVFSGILRRKVFDRTGLAGYFDVKLKWTPDLVLRVTTPHRRRTAARPSLQQSKSNLA